MFSTVTIITLVVLILVLVAFIENMLHMFTDREIRHDEQMRRVCNAKRALEDEVDALRYDLYIATNKPSILNSGELTVFTPIPECECSVCLANAGNPDYFPF